MRPLSPDWASPGPGRRRETASPPPGPGSGDRVRVSEVLAGFSLALDLSECQPMGHALRTCLVAMEIARRLDLPLADRRDLYFAALVKDIGGSWTSSRVYELFGASERIARRDLRHRGWERIEGAPLGLVHVVPGTPWLSRATRLAGLARRGPHAAAELADARSAHGAEMVTRLGLGAGVARTVAALDERWDGRGQPRGLRGPEIPITAQVLALAQALEVWGSRADAHMALATARARACRRFAPAAVAASAGLESRFAQWSLLEDHGLDRAVRLAEPGDAALLAGPARLDGIAESFATVVDAKSPWMQGHSQRVAWLALALGARLGLAPAALRDLRRAALLHDLGRLSIPSGILEKPALLTAQEWDAVRLDPWYTHRILERVAGFSGLAWIASSHHERMDGRGYFRGLRQDDVPLAGQLIAAADTFDALVSARPFRPARSPETALRLIERDRGIGIRAECYEALVAHLEEGESPGGGEQQAA